MLELPGFREVDVDYTDELPTPTTFLVYAAQR
jgi:hypothetical protein